MAGRGLNVWMLLLSCGVAGSGVVYVQNAYLWDGLYAGLNAHPGQSPPAAAR